MYRYIGNKSRILAQLLPIITQGATPSTRFADLMCGTASVAAGLRGHGYPVTAGDLLTFAVNHAVARLRFDAAPTFGELGGYEEVLGRLNALDGVPGYFTQEYSDAGAPASGDAPRRYLTGENAARLDAMSDRLAQWRRDGLLDDERHALLRHDLVRAVNRVANIAGTYGHFRADFGPSSRKPIELQPNDFEPGATAPNRVLQGRVEDLAGAVDVDVLYLDPPYKKRQYAANYHLLETVAVADGAPAIGKSGLRDWWPQYSDFCSKLKIGGAFESVLTSTPAPRVFVSYSEDGLLTEQQMLDLLGRFGTVRLHRFEHSRFRSNASPLAPKLEEFVFEIDRR